MECPCHGSRYDRLGIKADGPQYGPAPRSMDRFSITVDGDGVLTIDTGKITLGPAAGRARSARASSRRARRPAASDAVTFDTDLRGDR